MTLQRIALMGAGSVGAAAADPFFSNVSLLIPGTGSNNSTTLTDLSPSPKDVTAYGSAKIITGVADPFGSTTAGVIDFPDVPTNVGNLGVIPEVRAAHSSQFNFGASDFTIELWYYPVAQADFSSIFSRDGTDFPITLYHGTGLNSGKPSFAYGTTTSWIKDGLDLGAVSNNAWSFIAISRNSGVMRGWRGTTLGSAATLGFTDTSSSAAIGDVTADFVIGRNGPSGGARSLRCRYREIRITTGVGRYPSSCTVPSAAFPAS